mmetsp:Transcript_23562/g.66110  ORF Transcript_23562/g.66110 Transcript_23562/m.66110 type:complete len:279 (-) Transcript_23562:4723-5559(-)
MSRPKIFTIAFFPDAVEPRRATILLPTASLPGVADTLRESKQAVWTRVCKQLFPANSRPDVSRSSDTSFSTHSASTVSRRRRARRVTQACRSLRASWSTITVRQMLDWPSMPNTRENTSPRTPRTSAVSSTVIPRDFSGTASSTTAGDRTTCSLKHSADPSSTGSLPFFDFTGFLCFFLLAPILIDLVEEDEGLDHEDDDGGEVVGPWNSEYVSSVKILRMASYRGQGSSEFTAAGIPRITSRKSCDAKAVLMSMSCAQNDVKWTVRSRVMKGRLAPR